MSTAPAELLESFLPEVLRAATLGPVLDLACGGGRNGLAVLARGAPVVFADRRSDALEEVRTRLATVTPPMNGVKTADASFWQVDLESPGADPLDGKHFGAILAFRYLHRPLFASIKAAIRPGGLIVYETFTVDQPQYGRPTNPDFLLRHGELPDYFEGWEVLHTSEGVVESETSEKSQAVARLVARKPV